MARGLRTSPAAHRLPSVKPQRNAAIVAAYLSGASTLEVAAQFGISKQRVAQIIANAGVRLRPRGRPLG